MSTGQDEIPHLHVLDTGQHTKGSLLFPTLYTPATSNNEKITTAWIIQVHFQNNTSQSPQQWGGEAGTNNSSHAGREMRSDKVCLGKELKGAT